MPLSLIDLLFLVAVFFIAKFIIKQNWLSTTYDFVKFCLIIVITFFLTKWFIPLMPHYFFFSTMQFIVVSQFATFLVLWRLLNFKGIFQNIPLQFRSFGIYLNYLSAGITGAFFVFSAFLFVTSFNTKFLMLYDIGERSYIVRLVSFRLYIAYFNSIPPLGDLSKVSGFGIKKQQDRINEEREKEGLPPVGMQNAYLRIPTGAVTQNIPLAPTAVPTSQPEPTIIIIPITIVPRARVLPSPRPNPTVKIVQRTVQTRVVTKVVPTQIPIPTSEPTPTSEPINISVFEQRVFDLTNVERVNNNLPPFTWNDSVAVVARAHSVDMMNRGFFAHVNPDGITLGQRLRIGGVKYGYAAENIARGYGTPERFVQGWMESPGHRKNILNPSLKKLGVGVSEAGPSNVFATQDFTD